MSRPLVTSRICMTPLSVFISWISKVAKSAEPPVRRSGVAPLFSIVRYAPPTSAPFGVARAHGFSITMSPALDSCASAGAAPKARASATRKIDECFIACPSRANLLGLAGAKLRSIPRLRLHGKLEGSLCVVGIDRYRLPVHFVLAGREGFGDRHDQHSLVAGSRRRSSQGHTGAARAGQRDLRKSGLDALAELEPDFGGRRDRPADMRGRL